MDRVRAELRVRHYSPRTEKSYCGWIRRYIAFNDRRHPRELGVEHVRSFLAHLAEQRQVAASTQNQALAALLFLYERVLGVPIERLGELVRPPRPDRLPVVLTPGEVAAVLAQMTGSTWLMTGLLYGSGLRLLECCQLRVKDVDLERREIRVRDPKGRRDRVTVVPLALLRPVARAPCPHPPAARGRPACRGGRRGTTERAARKIPGCSA